MATLVLTAVGTAFGGPIGAAIGSLIGSQIDAAIFKPAPREGPRLKELSITTSSYGTAVGRHFGTVRAAGSIIWATNLVESNEKVGGGKGRPSTVTYSYSISFAVALASRPILSIGRIWADGNLLRGAAGDMKVGGELRIYTGHGDQLPDPLLASAEAGACPAFRGMAYCVFESLQLADFGNRIPTLTFEITSDEGEVLLQNIVSNPDREIAVDRQLPGLAGFSEEGGTLATHLAALSDIYPMACSADGDSITLFHAQPGGATLPVLAEAVVDQVDEGFGGPTGKSSRRQTDLQALPSGLRYYDKDRDFLPGMQRPLGRALPGNGQIVEFPGALAASSAQRLIAEMAQRARWSQETLQWRTAEINPDIHPGMLVTVPDRPGIWQIDSWEWRESGIELELSRQPQSGNASLVADPGRVLSVNDQVATPTILHAFELPWDGTGSPDDRQALAAASSQSSGWTGAMLYAELGGGLAPLTGSGSRRSVMGTTTSAVAAGTAHLFDRSSIIEVQLASTDFTLASGQTQELAQGFNRALLGEEIVQFAVAEHLGAGNWRLSGLLRGRGGTEHHAAMIKPVGTVFVLLDDRPVRLAADDLGSSTTVAAIGLVDPDPVVSPVSGNGNTLQPLTPVHPRAVLQADGSTILSWTRRARGAWTWNSTVEPPLVEQTERYEVGVGNPDQPVLAWEVLSPQLFLSAPMVSQIQGSHSGLPLWVRQIGSHSRSYPLLLLTI